MKIEIRRITNWSMALSSARFTQRKEPISGEPSIKWKKKLIKAEHSPLRCVLFNIDMYDIPYRTSVHFVRHVHAQPFGSTSRPDIDGKMPPRSEQKKDDPVNLRLFLNAEEIINISRKRLCNKAEKETRKIWRQVIEELRKTEPELANACVPNCLYRGFCPEFKSCGFADSELFVLKLHDYFNSL
jgi:hypothetical protein